jgi:hypothetical protein
MLYIRQGATHKVVVGPAVAVGDGFTPVATLALTTADEAEAILHDNGTVVDISGYTWAAITTADGYYHLTLQSGISGTVGHMTIVINDDSLILPLRADFTVLEEAVYDAMFAATAPGYVANAPVNVAQVSGDGTAADTLELFAEALDQATGQLDSGSLAAGTITAAAIADAAIDAATFAAGAIDAAVLAADAATEIRNAVTGGAYALDTDANGRIRIVDGTGAGELNTTSGGVDVATIEGLDATDQINAACDAAIVTYGLDHLLAASVIGTDITDNSIIAKLVSKSATADWDSFVNTTDALEALRDRGDAEWITATGFSTHSAADVWAAATRTLTALGFTLDSDDTDATLIAEIQAAITGGAYTLATDANGRIEIVDGTGVGQLDTSGGLIAGIAGTITTLDGLDTAQDTQHSTTQGRLPAALVGGRMDATIDATGMEAGAIDAILTRQMTESYAANGAAPTVAEALFAIHQKLMARQYAGLTSPVLKLDGVTEAFQGTMDDAVSPTEDIRVPA